MALIAPEVDMGCTALIGATTLILMFIAGTRLFYLVPMVALGLAGDHCRGDENARACGAHDGVLVSG